ncbi:hypothetical protein GCM10010319_60670 [Streptomyces blastmyceticus]|uniref:HTH cro/C1-type domain-containing protein n=2 Tax=Streptomyces blastmyceticus TaxID=68180 RepID=A0ABN0XVI8_9ACTN
MSAGKISKIENGRVTSSVTDVDLILKALGVSDAPKAEFLKTARLVDLLAPDTRCTRFSCP